MIKKKSGKVYIINDVRDTVLSTVWTLNVLFEQNLYGTYYVSSKISRLSGR